MPTSYCKLRKAGPDGTTPLTGSKRLLRALVIKCGLETGALAGGCSARHHLGGVHPRAAARDLVPTSNPSEIAIIIPTVNRSGLLRPLLDNIHEATETPHQVYFVVESSDEPTLRETAELKSPHVSIIGAYGSYTRAANAGVRATKEPLILVANDDVVFHFGWDRAALERMQEPVLVVGIDQGNGRFDCFFLVDSRYIT
jgi:hypothetical protein